MNTLEKTALQIFMFEIFVQLHPNWTEYPLEQIERIYENEGESENFRNFPDDVIHAFFMKRSLEVIQGKRRYV
jgi:hypothetical protein